MVSNACLASNGRGVCLKREGHHFGHLFETVKSMDAPVARTVVSYSFNGGTSRELGDAPQPWLGGTIRISEGGGATAAYPGTFVEMSLSSIANVRMISMTCEQRLGFLHEIARGYHVQVIGCGEAMGPVGASDICKCGRI